VDLQALAAKATYEGSGEHKSVPNPLCDPALRKDASDCDKVVTGISSDRRPLTAWLREAIRRGQVDRVVEGEFPRHVWAWIPTREGPRLVEGRLTNSGLGQYKGYFIEDRDLIGKRAWVRALLLRGSWSKVLS
jgi:hypothetical protein